MRLIVATVGVIALASSASAADIAYKAPAAQVVVPSANWTGIYLGGHVGGSWGKADTSNSWMTTNGVLTSNVPGLNAGTFAGLDRSFDLNGSFTGGVQVGYNYEFSNRVVLGIEGDFAWADNKGNDSYIASVEGPTYSSESKTEWFATIRGRAGYSFGTVLPYVTGGVAFVHNTGSVRAIG